MRKFHIYQMTKKSSYSWTHTLKSIASKLMERGETVIYNIEGSKYSIPDPHDISISFTEPTRIKDIPGNNKFIIYTYETSILPKTWPLLINISNCKIISPSNFCTSIFLNNKISKDKIINIPLGVDKNIFKREKSYLKLTDKKFVFGTVSINHKRKGLVELATSYLNTFNGDDNVSLIIKTNKPSLYMEFHELDVQKEINALIAKYDNPAEIKIITEYIDIKEFYNYIHVFVSATKTEGFFYPILEAMACETPVVCTGYGGHTDFLNSSNGYLVDYDIRDARKEEQYWCNYKTNSKIAEPNLKHLSEILKYILINYNEALSKTKVGLETVNKYSWGNTINRILDHVPPP